MKRINYYLASANTGDGFINHFHNIAKDEFLYILKGGPGTGKSTLLKKVGEYFAEKGEPIEYFYCSSDSKSLDGIRLCQHNFVIVDGTAPHITEVKLPMINGKIVNLGDAIDHQIIDHKTIIEQKLCEKDNLYKTLYNYLSLMKQTYKCAFNESIPQNIVVNQYDKLLYKLNLQDFDKMGSVRDLFINYWGNKSKSSFVSLNRFQKIYYIDGSIQSNNNRLLKLSEFAQSKGYDVIRFKNIVCPEFISSICLPQLNIFIGSREKVDKINKLHFDIFKKYEKLACKTLTQIQKLHKEVESYYIKCMNFSEIEQITARIIGDIERRIDEKSND